MASQTRPAALQILTAIDESEPRMSYRTSVRRASISDMKGDLPSERMGISLTGLRRRIGLEIKMKSMLRRIVVYTSILACYFFMIQNMFPAGDLRAVHRRIEATFQLDRASAIEDLTSLYKYVEDFGKTNVHLKADSILSYWCEDSAYQMGWNANLLQPQQTCDSSGRRLHFSDCNESSCTEKPKPKYERRSKFLGPLITLTPALVSQWRFDAQVCDGFAHRYQKQGSNLGNFFAPSSDGVKKGNLTLCLNRSQYSEADYAFEIPCPVNASDECPTDGVLQLFPKRVNKRHNIAEYPQLLMDVEKDLDRLKAVQFVDAQTDRLWLSTLIYIEGLEIFSVLDIEFLFDKAGNIRTLVHVRSWKEHIDSAMSEMVTSGALAVILSFLGCMWTLYLMNWEGASILSRFELCTRGPLCMISFVVMVWWATIPSIAKVYENVLRQERVHDSEDPSGVLDAFDEAAFSIWDNVGTMDLLQVLCFIVALLQILQIVAYFHVHDGVAAISSTAMRAWSAFAHLMTIVVLFFLLLGFVVHWLFGDDMPSFATYGKALATQLRMMYGDFLYASDVSRLDGAGSFMYWVYAVVFMVLLFFLLLDLFIAIVVDAFNDHQEEAGIPVARTFVSDLYDALVLPLGKAVEWPDQSDIVSWLDQQKSQAPDLEVLTLKDFRSSMFRTATTTHDSAKEFMMHYCSKIPALQMEAFEPEIAQPPPSTSMAEAPTTVPAPLNQSEATKLLSRKAILEISRQLADKDLASPQQLQQIDWVFLTARLSCSVYRHLRESGLASEGDDDKSKMY